MTKKEKLAAILPLLKELNEIEQRLVKNSKINTAIYDDFDLNKLIKKKSPVQNFRGQMKDIKITRAAKNLSIGMYDDISLSFNKLASNIISNVGQINLTSSLTPRKSDIDKEVKNCFATIILDDLKSNYIDVVSDIFNQGRLHQTVNLKDVKLAKFATAVSEEYTFVSETHKKIENNFVKIASNVQDELSSNIENLVASGIMRNELDVNLEIEIFSFLENFRNQVQGVLLEAYAAGNLYQLKLDKVDQVRWDINNQLNSCKECRAIQTGDLILKYEGQELPHVKTIFGQVSYYFDSIWQIANEKSARFFNHDDCTCAFIQLNNY